MTTTEPIIVARALSRKFGAQTVLDHLDLSVAPGEKVGFRGPNGSGKTTALRCLAGTLTPTSGELTIGGHAAGSAGARRIVGASLAQERSFYLRLTGFENLRFFARLRHKTKRMAEEDVSQIVDELQIAPIAAQRVAKCSTGMVQQLAFARALLAAPRVILLDEPTRSLDDDAIERLWSALDARPEATVVMASHHHADLDRCERVLDFGGEG